MTPCVGGLPVASGFSDFKDLESSLADQGKRTVPLYCQYRILQWTAGRVVFISLRQSKTDVFWSGVTVHLGRTGDILCPVSALLSYLAVRPPTPGPLFLLRSGNPL